MSKNDRKGGGARPALRAAYVSAALSLLTPTPARAQATGDEPTPATPPAPAPEGGDQGAVKGADLATLAAEVAAQRKALESAQKAIDDLRAKADTPPTAGEGDWTSKFKIYGFTDVGVNHVWAKRGSALAAYVPSANTTSFVIGNLNLYFDAQPIKNWRSLVEIRFTNAPHGEVKSIGGLTGQPFARTSTEQFDPHSTSTAMPMWGGYTVIERAYVEWTQYQALKVRVGNFFTPFGIWNVDHGTPTLIALQLPGLITQEMMPLRQTGLQIYGNAFAGAWELGYAATLTNGRQELSNFAFDDNRGFGGRVYASNESGDVTTKFGASFYTGRARDQSIELVSLAPLRFGTSSTYAYRELVGGLDFALDASATRVRAEVAMSTIDYDPGKHQPSTLTPGAFQPDQALANAYALVAHQLPFAGLEPYASLDLGFGSKTELGDAYVAPSMGLNVRFNASVMLKSQLTRAYFLETGDHAYGEGGYEGSINNSSYFYSRLVLVF